MRALYSDEERESVTRRVLASMAAATAARGPWLLGNDIAAAWASVNPAVPVPKEAAERRWLRLLRTALVDGRVVTETRHGVRWFALAPRPMEEPPTQKPVFERGRTTRVLERAVEARAALQQALDEHGVRVTSVQIADAWRTMIIRSGGRRGRAMRVPTPAKIRDALVPFIVTGEVEVQNEAGHLFFGDSTRAGLTVPAAEAWSDLRKVEHVLTALVRERGSAVTARLIAETIDRCPDFTITGRRALHSHLNSLVQWRRAVRIKPRPRSQRAYFSIPGGPIFVDPGMEATRDLRVRAIEALWRQTDGRPFTTRAVRRFAEGTPHFRIADDPPYAWTLALQNLEQTGYLVRAGGAGTRNVRWALATEWSKLSDTSRTERLEDVVRSKTRIGGTGGPRLPHDAAFVSRAHNMRWLIEAAKERAARASEEQRSIILRRPVHFDDLIETALTHRDLVPSREASIRQSVWNAMREAARVRPEMRQAHIVKIGVVGNRTYYDTARTVANTAAVEALQRLWAASAERHDQSIARLREAIELAATMRQPLPHAVLEARARELEQLTAAHAAEIQRAMECEDLLPGEHAASRQLDRAAQADLVAMQRILGDLRVAPVRDVAVRVDHIKGQREGHLVVLREAIAELATAELAGAKGTRLYTVSRRIARRTRPTGPEKGTGRIPVVRVDRIDVLRDLSERCAGADHAVFTHVGTHTLGDLRDDRLLADLFRNDPSARVPGVAAALALLDTVQSETVLNDYLRSCVHGQPWSSGSTALRFTTMKYAIYGLARRPALGLRTELSPRARDVLDMIVRQKAWDDTLRGLARSVAVSWTDGWPAARLLTMSM